VRRGLAALALLVGAVGCTGEPVDPLVHALQHTAEPGDVLGPADSDPVARLAAAADVQLGADPTLYVASGPYAPPESPLGWTRLATDQDRALWRRRDPVAASQVAVQPDDLPGAVSDVPEGSPVRGVVQHGPASPGGELALTLFLQPPARMPRRPCLSLQLDERRLELGTLLDGRGGFIPGAGPRPVVRHRAWTPLPQDWPIGTYDVAVRLHTCDTLRDLSPPTPVSLTVSRTGLPTRQQLQARPGTPHAQAEWATPRGRRTGLRRGPDGELEVVEAPPLPRVLRGQAWGVLVTPPVDPAGWPVPDGTVGPLDGLASLFEEADASFVHWGAAAELQGASPKDRPVTRVQPAVLGHVASLDVDGLLLGADAWAVGGASGTQRNAEALGLSVAGLDVGQDERAVSVSLVNLTAGPGLADEVRRFREQLGPEPLLLGAVEGPVDDPRRLARTLARSGVDAGWIVDEQPGPVILHDGVPVLAGVPPMGAASTRAFALRWYVAPQGVIRLDLIALEQAGGRWSVVRDGSAQDELQAVADASEPLGTWVAVGQNLAAVDVTAHGPERERVASVPRDLSRPQPTGLPEPTLPERCQGQVPESSEPIPVGDDLELLQARLVRGESVQGSPVIAELLWRARRPLPAGSLQWYVAGVSGTWRASTTPCDGMWGFERFTRGQVVRDRVLLFPPPGVEPSTGTLQLGVKLGDERPDLGGERFLDVGPVVVE